MRQILLAAVLSATIASCTNSKGENPATNLNEPTTSVKITSKELNEDFDKAWNNRDTTKLYSLLADDVQLLDGPLHTSGKQEVIDKFIRRDIAVTSNLKTKIVSSGEDNSIAYEAGTFSLDVTLPNSKPFVSSGNYNFVWKKGTDNLWKIVAINMEDVPLQKKN